MNIVNTLALLKEINDSRGEGAALIAQLRGCGPNVLREHGDVLIFFSKSERARQREREVRYEV